MPAAAQALTVVAAQSSPQKEIANYLDLREQAKAALIELEAERLNIPADLARQIASQAAGKPKLDTDAVLAQYKSVKTKQDQLQDKTAALEFLLNAVNTRLDELKASLLADFTIVLRQRITEQHQVTTKEQDEAQHAQELLDALNREFDEITQHPEPASSAAALPGVAAAASSPGGPRAAAAASARSRSKRRRTTRA
jgi:hypothetical protein